MNNKISWLGLQLVAIFSCSGLAEKPMVVIVPSYNNAMWYENNLRSIYAQNYTNYRVIYIDDCSTDGTADLVASYVAKNNQGKRTELVRNVERKGALANLYSAIHSCRDNEIIVTIDGDDWLFNNDVLSLLNTIYSKKDVWLTHGSLSDDGWYKSYWSIPIPKNIIKKNLFRTFRCPSHLRTFYAGLFKKIKTDDLMHNGEFFPMAWDQAIMFPMVEMAGKRHAYIPEILYVYNMWTPLNDNKVNPDLQRDLESVIRNMPSYQKLSQLF